MECDRVDVLYSLCLSVCTPDVLSLLQLNKEVLVRLPKLIYEAYPILYILGGVATMSMVNSGIAFWSGLILGLSGTIILFLRRNYRAIRQHLFSY